MSQGVVSGWADIGVLGMKSMRELKLPGNVSGRILHTLRAIEGELPLALKRLTRYILEHANEVTTQNVTEIAAAASVGEATVVRLAKTMKFPGFKEFQLELVKELAGKSQSGDEQILDSNIEDGDDCVVMAKKLKLAITRSLNENIHNIDKQTCLAVADAIYKARKVFIIGVGNSCLSALFFKNKLCRIGIDAQAESMDHFMYTALAMMGPSDVVIALSQKGNSYETLKAFEIGKDSGALAVAITNNPVGRLVRLADYVIYNGNEEGMLQGDSAATIAAQIHICELLYSLVVSFNRTKATKTKQITLQALGRTISLDLARD